MTDVLIVADTTRSQELRHELPLMIPDPVIYLERDGVRHVVGSSFEEPRLTELGGSVFHPFEEFGLDELRRSGISRTALLTEIAVRATQTLGLSEAIVPASFPLLTADRLREAGVVLTPAQELFDARRRVKSEAELAGIRRAQAAAEAGMAAARDLLRRAVADGDGGLAVEDRPLRSEELKAVIARAFIEHGATAEELIVSHGAQSASAHHLGDGVLRAGEPIVIDVWPRDGASSCFADMTRTFVVGEIPDELLSWHSLCTQALERALRDVRAGVRGGSLFDGSCEIFEAAGYPTQRTRQAGERLERGFVHSLGHGVGLAVHEEPLLALAAQSTLVAGDVITIEPGLYRPGFGGLRLEDLVLVTENGGENLTRFPYALTP